MLTALNIIVISAGAALLLLWLVLFIRGLGRDTAKLFDGLEEREFPLKDVYFVGYEALEIISYAYTSKHDRKLRRELEVLRGEKYTDYYLRVIHAGQITLSLTIAVAAFIFYALSNEITLLIVFLTFAVLAYYTLGKVTEKQIFKRSDEMLSEFSEVISKLALLTNAGMILREAWEKTAFTGNGVLYKEMQLTVTQLRNGVSETDALFAFGSRCMISEVKKFTSTITAATVRGGGELAQMLKEQSASVWNARQQYVRREGEKAASKLLFPMMIMFVGILIMILIPIFSGLGI